MTPLADIFDPVLGKQAYKTQIKMKLLVYNGIIMRWLCAMLHYEAVICHQVASKAAGKHYFSCTKLKSPQTFLK